VVLFVFFSPLLLQYAFAQPSVSLNPVPSSVQEGITITFSGMIELNNEPLNGQTVTIKDGTTGKVIGTTASGPNGGFNFTWTSVARPEKYLIYAELYVSAESASFSSNVDEIIVLRPTNSTDVSTIPVKSITLSESLSTNDTISTSAVKSATMPETITSSDLPNQANSTTVSTSSDISNQKQNQTFFSEDIIWIIVGLAIVGGAVYYFRKYKSSKPPIPTVEIRGGLEPN
jgi:hypothetical protein